MYATVHGVDIAYELTGSGDETVTLLHGLSMTYGMWDQQVPVLAERFRVLRYDLRGLGRSGKPAGPYSIAQFAGDLEALLDHLAIRRTHLLAFSLGGLVAQVFTLTRPQRVGKLILADTQSRYSAAEGVVFENRARAAAERQMDATIENRLNGWFTPEFRAARPDRIARYREMLSGADPVGYPAAALTVPGFDVHGRLHEIASPTLVIVGEHDPGTPPEKSHEIVAAIPGARLAELPGRHVINEEAAEAFNQLVLEFLSEA